MADQLDILTLDEAKAILDIGEDDDSSDVALERVITAVSNRLDAACGPVVKRTVGPELYPGGSGPVLLREYPAVSVTTVREAFGGSISTLSAVAFGGTGDGYSVDLSAGTLSRYAGGLPICWRGGSESVEVTYVAGRYDDTEAVDARFKEAAGLMLRNAWRAYEQAVGEVGEYAVPAQSFPGFAVPNAVRDLLYGDWREIPGVA